MITPTKTMSSPVARSAESPRVARFGPFEADLNSGELRKQGVRIKLQEQPFQILSMLLENPGQVITREELQRKLWAADTFVDFDHGLGTAINKLRQGLGDSADSPRYIETIPRRGFRFIGVVEGLTAQTPPAGNVKITHAWIGAALIVTLLAVGSYMVWARFRTTTHAPAGRVMLAVLPFDNLGNPDQDYFSDGLTEEVITQLGALEPGRLGVIARNSVMAYKRTNKSAAQIGQDLGVDYILEGTVRREGARTRITVQLIQIKSQTYLWAQSYERDLGSILAFHSEVGRDVARQVQIQLTPQSQGRLASHRPVNPAAYEAYLKGLYFWNKMTVEGLYKSLELFQQSIDRDPEYAPAYSGLAAAYAGLVEFGQLPPADAYPKSAMAARKALELDEMSTHAHAALSWSLVYYDHDWAAAEREFRRALKLNPSNAEARTQYARYLAAIGKFEEALDQIELARQTDPISPLVNVTQAQILFYERQYDAALDNLRKVREIDPDFPPIYWTQAHVYEAVGKNAEASQSIVKTWDLASNHAQGVVQLEQLRAGLGWQPMWEQVLQGMVEGRGRGEYQQPYGFVEAQLILGRDSEAIEALRTAAEVHDNEIVFINVDPRFDHLRSDPRFQKIVASMNFPK